MRSKIITTIIVTFCSVHSGIGCVSWRIGKVYVVDENNKPITDVILWRFYSLNDSFKMSNNLADGHDTSDPLAYTFWAGGGRSTKRTQRNPANKYLLIQAKGYADVIIKELKFIRGRSYGSDLPVLYIKMYPKKYVKKGDLYTLMNQYVCDRKLEVEDTMVVDFDIYTENIRQANMVTISERTAAYVVRTYPNPVKDKLNIDINAVVTKPYKATLLDVQGRLVSETELVTQNSILDMEWQAAGIYFIHVYDPQGILLYAYKFMKT